MAEPTQDTTTEEDTAPTAYGFCSWHHRFSAGVRLIDVIEQGSGPGAVHYACPPCITTYRLVPFADR